MGRKLIKNATIVSVDADIGNIMGGDILIDGSKIVEIGRNISVDDAEDYAVAGAKAFVLGSVLLSYPDKVREFKSYDGRGKHHG